MKRQQVRETIYNTAQGQYRNRKATCDYQQITHASMHKLQIFFLVFFFTLAQQGVDSSATNKCQQQAVGRLCCIELTSNEFEDSGGEAELKIERRGIRSISRRCVCFRTLSLALEGPGCRLFPLHRACLNLGTILDPCYDSDIYTVSRHSGIASAFRIFETT